MYAIVDLETTGGNAKNGKIIEVAIVLFDGTEIEEVYSTLINPERPIDYFITGLTGINNRMVAKAPKFQEVAKKIIELTDNRIFVAHNADFDYNFLRGEFKRLGYEYQKEILCTVELSRSVLPGHQSYSLGKICKDLGIEVEGRHRAKGDAVATTELLKLALQKNNGLQIAPPKPKERKTSLPPDLLPEVYDKLPSQTGVYYFYDKAGDLIYIGKSVNIKQRVASHFSNFTTKRAVEMKQRIADIGYELTGSELIALLLESDEIKKHKPVFNRAQRRASFRHGIYHAENDLGYIEFKIELNGAQATKPIATFASQEEAKNFLEAMTEKLSLCQKYMGLYKTHNHCFQYLVKKCQGACLGEESPEQYNLRAMRLIEGASYVHDNFFIMEKGREDGERGFVYIENGEYKGFGYVGKEIQITRKTQIKAYIKPFVNNKDTKQIIYSYINAEKNKNIKLLVMKKQEPKLNEPAQAPKKGKAKPAQDGGI